LITHIALNLETDRYSEARRYTIEPGTIVLLEGVFLMRPELAPFVDFMIFLDIAPDVALERADVRDRSFFGAETIERYKSKYLPAQARYLATFPPEEYANMIVDNTDWLHPTIKMMRSHRLGSGASADRGGATTGAQE
jgi:uridine kinase